MIYEKIIEGFSDVFKIFEGIFPEDYRFLAGLIFYIIFILIYAVFIWKFYIFLSKRELISLNLKQYNKNQSPLFAKFLAGFLDFIEYVIILPVIVFFWFTIFALFLLILSSQEAYSILLITAAVIASTRIAAYISEDLSKDLAKMFPFTILALFLLDPKFFDFNDLFSKINQIPSFFNQILVFMVFIIILEISLRVIYILYQLIYSKEE
jgi:hypothetical protein